MPILGKSIMGNTKVFPPAWILLDDFTDGNFTASPAWTEANPGDWSAATNKLVGAYTSGGTQIYTLSLVSDTQGTWALKMDRTSGYAQFAFVSTNATGGFFIVPPNRNGPYFIRIDGSTLYLYRGQGASCETCNDVTDVLLTSVAYTSASDDVYRIDRTLPSGLMHVYVNGVLKITYTDTTTTTNPGYNYIDCATNGAATFDQIYYNPSPTAGASPIG